MHQHAGFTGTGAGKHQLTPERGRYGLALGIVEGVQQEGEVVCVHRAILGPAGERANLYCINIHLGSGSSSTRSQAPGRRSGDPANHGSVNHLYRAYFAALLRTGVSDFQHFPAGAACALKRHGFFVSTCGAIAPLSSN